MKYQAPTDNLAMRPDQRLSRITINYTAYCGLAPPPYPTIPPSSV
ncbi:hypothetical protein MICAB_5140019 [Microcystis aeruginosa PCC 9717]|uniref:Uncharacterized protein n=1 Tax=Microcystis aeruginosa PCC 9717 TaxID=1160286 RepID=I4FSR6_MICAE|nr:hypothetical protein MICAB_5140019 [Microcystis aeruginosa PCC 9717]